VDVPSTYTFWCNKAGKRKWPTLRYCASRVGGAYLANLDGKKIAMVAYTALQGSELREGLGAGHDRLQLRPIEWATFSELEGSAPYCPIFNTGSFTTFPI